MLYGINNFITPSFERFQRRVEYAIPYFRLLAEDVSIFANGYLSSCLRKSPHEPPPTALVQAVRTNCLLPLLDLDDLEVLSSLSPGLRELFQDSFQQKKAQEAQKARDTLAVWKCLARAIEEEPIQIDLKASEKELIQKASGFTPWCEQNKDALNQITELHLSYNNLQTLPPQIGNLQNLEFLFLDKNNLQTLPPQIGNLQNLIILYLENNNLQTLPPEFGNLQNLGDFDLKNNKLQTLPPEIGNLQNLRRLDLGGNKLQTLPDSIGNLTDLKRLELRNNNLQTLPDSIGNLQDLQLLYLQGNNLEILPDEIGNLKSLRALNVENNSLDDAALLLVTELQNRTFPSVSVLYDNWMLRKARSITSLFQRLFSR